MQKLNLDFLRAGPASPLARWLLLALALAFLLDLAVSYVGVRHALEQGEVRLVETKRAARVAMRGTSGPRVPSAEEMQAARDTIERLTMPWNSLFGALESVANDKVRLLAIEPDPKSGTVLISGEAADYPAALEYAAQLGRTGALERAHLVRHDRPHDDPQQPIHFSISAVWSKSK